MTGVTVTVTVQIADGTSSSMRQSSQVIREHREPSGSDIRFAAVDAEHALADAARAALTRVVALHGDIRDKPGMHLTATERARPLTGPTET